jgi:ribosomal protein S18 acetylase RimI-like enzyme
MRLHVADWFTPTIRKLEVKRLALRIERSRTSLTSHVSEIQELADSERGALGFLPAKAFEEAIGRGRILAAVIDEPQNSSFAGYLLWSGVFPNAKVQQIATTQSARNNGVASALLKALISDLERIGFISIRADVASDLANALAFYTKNSFQPVRERVGGTTRARRIIVHLRELETENLFTLAAAAAAPLPDLRLRRRNTSEIPVFAFDLNVYFDLVRQRSQSENARRLFGEALGHTIRLVIANEFVKELRRTSNAPFADPVLQMALQLPRLPPPDPTALAEMADRIYDIVFIQRNAKGTGTEQAKSDAKHLAHATLSRATAFVTRDGPVLNARSDLLTKFGIDVVTVEEVLDLLPEQSELKAVALRGDGFELVQIHQAELSTLLVEMNAPDLVITEFSQQLPFGSLTLYNAFRCNGRIVAIGESTCRKASRQQPEWLCSSDKSTPKLSYLRIIS